MLIFLYPVPYFILVNPHWELIEPRCEPSAYPVPQKKHSYSMPYSVSCASPPQSTYIVTFIEYRAVSGVFHTPAPSPHHPASVSSPQHQNRGGTHSPGGEGVGGSIFWKTPDIGLASYNLIPLRSPRI